MLITHAHRPRFRKLPAKAAYVLTPMILSFLMSGIVASIATLRAVGLSPDLSEKILHGNAIDIAGFTFKSGKTFTIAPREEDATLNGAFQRTIASAACLYFSTVLDPGSDKAHETHLHLDTLKRKGGYRYCW